MRATVLVAPLAILALLLAMPTGGASCHMCIEEAAEEVRRLLAPYLP